MVKLSHVFNRKMNLTLVHYNEKYTVAFPELIDIIHIISNVQNENATYAVEIQLKYTCIIMLLALFSIQWLEK